MKAKDYAKQFNDNPTEETLKKIADTFILECAEIIKSRRANSDSAALAVLKEQDRKWIAFSNMVTGIRRDGFREITKEVFPEIIKYLGW